MYDRLIRLTAATVAVMVSGPSFAAGASGLHALGNPGQWITPDDYPAQALRDNLSGNVGFRLNVDVAGNVSACVITISSGQPILDKAACDLISARARFSPATNMHGKPVASTYTSEVRWQIPNQQLGFPLKASDVTIEFDVTKDGKIENCVDNGSVDGQRSFCDRFDRVVAQPGGPAIGMQHVIARTSIVIKDQPATKPAD